MPPSRPSRPDPDAADRMTQDSKRRPFSQTKGAALLAVCCCSPPFSGSDPARCVEADGAARSVPAIAGSAGAQNSRRRSRSPWWARAACKPGKTPGGRCPAPRAGRRRRGRGSLANAGCRRRRLGDRTRAIADLRLAVKALPSSLALQGALAQARSTDPAAPPAALALAIAPQGPTPLLNQYAAGSFLNPLAQWWGRRHPDQSGFATRQAWAGSRPGDARAQRLWGEALLENRRLPEAGAALSLALSLDPSSPDTHLALAQSCIKAARLPKPNCNIWPASHFGRIGCPPCSASARPHSTRSEQQAIHAYTAPPR